MDANSAGLPVTWLFVPGDRPDRFAKAMAAGADRVIIDLEDAVRPDAKPAARAAIAAAELDWRLIAIRINPASSPFWADDLAFLRQVRTAAIMAPKAETVAEITEVHEAAGGLSEVLPQIETALGLNRVDDILRAPGVRRVMFGHLDYALDIGAEPEWEALTHVRQTLVWRSRVAGRDAPVDSVTPELDEAKVSAEAMAARKLGFGGKLLIHPRQIPPAVSAFLPDAAQIDWARRVMEMVGSGGKGALVLDGRMIDKPVEDAARRILAMAGSV